jgi:hypothetical protein
MGDWAGTVALLLVVALIWVLIWKFGGLALPDIPKPPLYSETKITISLNCDSANFDEAMARAKEALDTFGVNVKDAKVEIKH